MSVARFVDVTQDSEPERDDPISHPMPIVYCRDRYLACQQAGIGGTILRQAVSASTPNGGYPVLADRLIGQPLNTLRAALQSCELGVSKIESSRKTLAARRPFGAKVGARTVGSACASVDQPDR